MKALWWIRRDLRLHDNPALIRALDETEAVVPVFVLDPLLLDSPYAGEARTGFLFAALRSLNEDLEKLGHPLVLRSGEPLAALRELSREANAERVYAQADHSPYAQQRDARVSAGLPVIWVGSPAIRPPGDVLKADGDPYVVFTPFRDRWEEGEVLGPADILDKPGGLPGGRPLASDTLPADPAHRHGEGFPASEKAARDRLSEFCQAGGGLDRYEQERDRLGAGGTSRLSPYLRFGMISAREAYVRGRAALTEGRTASSASGARTWLDELIWRDFYLHVLHFFPEARQLSFRAKYRGLRWLDDEGAFEAWRSGQTGYPAVDAAMRQLAASGWMHNRARMIVASFLVKDLLIDWRWGERHFMDQLLDGDPAANNGGWQWSAGTGTDAAPYFRIFNPVNQSKKHDPDGTYIRRWVPELARVPTERIHEPWKMDKEEQAATRCRIGRDYPAPIVDHGEARDRALEAYRAVR